MQGLRKDAGLFLGVLMVVVVSKPGGGSGVAGTEQTKHSPKKCIAWTNGEIIYELFAVHLKIPPVKLCLAT